MDFDYIIAGAGLAGCVIAERIATQLNKKVLIIEKRNHIGGNCYDYKDQNGILVHKYGPHLFHTNNKKVFQYLSNFTKWQEYQHEVLGYIDGQKVPIPFNFNTINQLFPEKTASKLKEKLMDKYGYNQKIPILELKKTKDKDLKFLAQYIYDKVFINYTAKQWNMKPEDIDSKVTARVPVFIGKDNRYFNDQYQCIPQKGYTHLIQNILDHPNIKIMTNTDFMDICKIGEKKTTFFNNTFKGKIIFTGMIDELFNFKFGELPYRSINLKFETVEKQQYQEKTTINYPNDYNFTRITEFKHIHPIETNKTTILKEYPQEYKKNENTPYYPIFTDINQSKYNKYLKFSKKFNNIILLGRLAEYKYYDMDDIVEAALKKFEEIK